MEKEKYNQISKLIKNSGNILITTHTNPDGDAIGSSLALYNYYIQSKGKNINVLVPNRYPAFLTWMPGNKEIIIHKEEPEKGKEILKNADVIFCLDFNSVGRIEAFSKELKQSNAVKILIDHHPQPERNFDYIISTIHTSSTAEMIYDFIVNTGGKHLLNKEIAECIYAGIMTDTGSFSYLCNYSKTYLIVAELIKTGVNGERIHGLVYDTFSEKRLRLLGYSLSERLKVLPEYHTAYIYLTAKDIKQFNYKVGDTEGIVNYPLSIEKIKFAALFREQNNKVRISLRSKGDFSVNEFAGKHFYGGGHMNAAGADSDISLKKTLDKFESILPQYKHQLDRIRE